LVLNQPGIYGVNGNLPEKATKRKGFGSNTVLVPALPKRMVLSSVLAGGDAQHWASIVETEREGHVSSSLQKPLEGVTEGTARWPGHDVFDSLRARF
jgi:hypothetical protein